MELVNHWNLKKFFLKFLINLVNIGFMFNKKCRVAIRDKIYTKFMTLLVKNLSCSLKEKFPEYWIFLPHYAIGDLIIFARCIKAFKAKFGGKVLVITPNKSRYDFMTLFPSIDKSIIIDKELYNYILFNSDGSTTLKPKGEIYALLADNFKRNKDVYIKNMQDVYKEFLNLSRECCDFENPKHSINDYSYIDELWCKNQLSDKTILLLPFANTFNDKVLTIDFWKLLANKLIDLGYDVVFSSQDKRLNKYKQIFLPLNKVGVFAEKCYASISLKSGLTDLISLYNAPKLIAIYLKNFSHKSMSSDLYINTLRKVYDFNPNLSISEQLFQIYSLEAVTNYREGIEIFFNGDREELLQKIFEEINKGQNK